MLRNSLTDAPQPTHYIDGRKYEPRYVIEDWNLSWNLGNVLKYISRAGRKENILEDLLKARDYINFELERELNTRLRCRPGKHSLDDLWKLYNERIISKNPKSHN